MKNTELAVCDLVCIIETKTRYRTMNVAHALAILLYEISRRQPEPRKARGKKPVDLASKEDIALLLNYVERLADAGNFDGHKKPLLDAAVKKMVAKSLPTAKDVMLLISLIRKGLLAIERGSRRQSRRN
jgi:tRNA C32,U32 (ribose-2'-O)-methylase TrmJ